MIEWESAGQLARRVLKIALSQDKAVRLRCHRVNGFFREDDQSDRFPFLLATVRRLVKSRGAAVACYNFCHIFLFRIA